MIIDMIFFRNTLLAVSLLSCSACIGTVVGVTTDVAVEVVKVPFKVAGAVIDVATPDKDEKK